MTASRELDSNDASVEASGSGARRRTVIVLAGSVVATIVAFRSVLLAPFGVLDLARFDYWFFIPDRDSGALSVVIACWLFWNRRNALSAARTQRIGWRHWGAALLISSGVAWATWTRLEVQLIPLLCATIVTLAAAWGGRSAVRLVSMPCVALLLAFPPPAPLQAEIIWRLQGLTATGANLLLTLAGYSTQLEGTEIHMGGHAFVIIEACSGWRGIQILSIVGLVAAELWQLPLRRMAWVVLAAIPLGVALNVLRACLVMLTQEELRAEFFESHTPQGLAVLLMGSVVLYALAASLRRAEEARPVEATRGIEAPERAPDRSFSAWALFSLALPIALASISLWVPLMQGPLAHRPRYEFLFPTSLPPWSGTPLDRDYFFPYSSSANSQFHVDYRDPTAVGGGEVVDLFVGRELPTAAGLDRMPDSKLLLPSNDWTLVSQHPVRVMAIGVDATEAIVSRAEGSQSAYVLAWRFHDRGLLRESLESLLVPRDCERAPNECLRAVVRIVVPFDPTNDEGQFRAARTANRFVDDFVLPLKSLELI